MKGLLFFSLGFLFLMGCKDKTDTSLLETKAGKEMSVPFNIVRNEGLEIEVFDFKNYQSLLHKKNDSIYIINFWATWCKPCVKELPDLERIQEEFKDQKVKVILTSLDFSDKIEPQLIPFIKKMNLQSQVLVLDEPDANSWIPKVDSTWSGAIPATLIYNRQQRRFHSKPLTYEELKNEIKPLLADKN